MRNRSGRVCRCGGDARRTKHADERNCAIADENFEQAHTLEAVLAVDEDAEDHEAKEESLVDDRGGAFVGGTRGGDRETRRGAGTSAEGAPVEDHDDGKVRRLAEGVSCGAGEAQAKADSHEGDLGQEGDDHNAEDTPFRAVDCVYCVERCVINAIVELSNRE